MYVKTEALSVGYNGKTLIGDINIGIEKGQILCLLGPNGSGKSTILKSITNQLEKISGTVYIGKDDLNLMNNKELAKTMSVVLTDRIDPELMTCLEVVATGRYPHTNHFGKLSEEDHEIINKSLEMVNACDLSDSNFSELSDGQKQRVLLARAICQSPDVIVLDEPTSYLDIRYKIELLSILRKMAIERNITVILSLHEVDLATKLADIIVLIKDNTIYKCGFPEDILDDKIISKLYDIKSGNFNLLLGSVELQSDFKEPKVFILAGDGKGASIFRAFQKKCISFRTGILHENDIDYIIAKGLACEVISQKSFTPIDSSTLNRAKEAILQSDVVVDSGFEIEEMNFKNYELIKFARDNKKIVMSLREKSFKELEGIDYFSDISSMINNSF